jgi:hypothetical protein
MNGARRYIGSYLGRRSRRRTGENGPTILRKPEDGLHPKFVGVEAPRLFLTIEPPERFGFVSQLASGGSRDATGAIAIHFLSKLYKGFDNGTEQLLLVTLSLVTPGGLDAINDGPLLDLERNSDLYLGARDPKSGRARMRPLLEAPVRLTISSLPAEGRRLTYGEERLSRTLLIVRDTVMDILGWCIAIDDELLGQFRIREA